MAALDNISVLTEYIISSIRLEKSVAIHGFGTFLYKKSPARFSQDSSLLYPPAAEVSFVSEGGNGNGDGEGANGPLADNTVVINRDGEISGLVRELKHTLLESGALEFPLLGIIRFGSEGSFVFEPADSFMANPDYYGLEAIAMKPKVQERSGKEKPGREKTGRLEQVEKKTDGNEDAVEKRKAPKTGRIILYVFLGLIAVIFICVITLLLFKEELMPLLRQLLYSKEELEILNTL